jgi:hypothetical protein
MADFAVETKADLRDALTELLQWCGDDGMTFPVIMCAVSPNGSILVNRIDGTGASEVLAQHFEGGGFAVPMTIMVLDQNNVAVKATIDHSGKMSWH